MNTKKYTPIHCGLYDQLEAFSVLKTTLQIVYISSDKEQVVEEANIIDFKTQKDGEFALITSGEAQIKLRLDQIISINGSNVHDEFGNSCTF